MKNLIDILDLTTSEIDELILVANDIIESPEKYAHKCDGKKLATLFFEPSTRTRLSFEAAMCSDFLKRRVHPLQREKALRTLLK